MTTQAENELMTRTGPGTPAGEWIRNYWQPLALSEELPQGGRPLPVRLMSEDLVLFRDEEGRIGCMQRQCPHRRTDLSYGRLEDGGLRCLYHGWLFGANGRCLEMPAEPPESPFKDELRFTTYPTREMGGIIFTYMGKGEAPVFPLYEPFMVPEENRLAKRQAINCNYLQTLEGGFDPVHLSYLHRPIGRKDNRPVPGSTLSADNYYASDRRPTLEYERTGFGMRMYSIRKSGEDKKYVRTTNYIMPTSVAIVGQEGRIGQGFHMHWYVPTDDAHTMRFDLVFNRVKPLDKVSKELRWNDNFGPDGQLRSADNRYHQDPELMRNSNFTGMGDSFNVHDAFATESMGVVSDRPLENLATSDRIIAQARRLIIENIKKVEAGQLPVNVARGQAQDPEAPNVVVISEVIPNEVDHKEFWKSRITHSVAAE
ncbi:MAG TPA: Rieske 2Fe-2S domain-containing protein [Alphaproteobacteria bacterium]|jgi:phenylpropionate dioxygenase-like ring-hydroxylating dioxygenase large terminal subunit